MINNLLFNYYINIQIGGIEKKWRELNHNGVLFPDEYIYNEIPLIYNNKEIVLNKEAEEYALYYSRYINTEYTNNKKFNKNFWKDWVKLIDKKLNINDFEKCNFKNFIIFLEKKREINLKLLENEKKIIKDNKDKYEEKYKYSIIDGKKQVIGNYRVEPPGIFLGRGCHPKTGSIKKRILPKDITINIGKDSKIPEINLKGDYKWGEIIHDNNVIWLASWLDPITKKYKYVFPGDTSEFKSKSDINKFNLAKKLKNKIGEIRKINNENLKSNDIVTQQLATILYLIDNLALRVGNEKSKDEADTVGVSSLRVEHITLLDDIKNKIKLDFLGKDSIRYINKFDISKEVYNNLNKFMLNKKSKDEIFDKIKSDDINKYLQTFMKNLTSKVFRTYNASNLFQKELNLITKKFENYEKEDKINLILDLYNKANAKVALLCNHQKKISKGFNNNINKINSKIKELKNKKKIYLDKKKINNSKSLRERIKNIDFKIKLLKSKKSSKIEMKSVSLGTSKINYIDPRITIAFLKKHNIDINKLFTKTLQQKFKWAFDIDENYKF